MTAGVCCLPDSAFSTENNKVYAFNSINFIILNICAMIKTTYDSNDV